MSTTEPELVARRGHGECSTEIVPAQGLWAKLKAECFTDPNLPPADIITTDDELLVRVTLCLQGDLRHHLCGRLCFKLAWDSCGPADDGEVVEWRDMDPCRTRDDCYVVEFRLPAGRLEAGECGTVYCFCVTVSSRTIECPNEDPPYYTGLIHGFCRDICCIMVRPA